MSVLRAGDRLELTIEKPVAGGRMLARHEGQIVLVSGAIPGERAEVVVERVDKRLAFAACSAVLEASPDRRAVPHDPLCGGCLYAHVALTRQRELKGQVVADAYTRIARYPLSGPVDVAASPELGYRMRARLHVGNGRVGFYREGTHEICDARGTGQLHPDAIAVVEGALERLAAADVPVGSIELSENLAADQRAVHIEVTGGAAVPPATLESLLGTDIVSASLSTAAGLRLQAGAERIADPLAAITAGRAEGELRRGAASFFQANRFLVPTLVGAVMDGVLPDGEVIDLYAGVGLFSMALAGAGRSGITAVEGQRGSGADLRVNAAAMSGRITPVVAPVEAYVSRGRRLPPTVIVDPPRTGLSKGVLHALAASPVRRLVYVSCDPPTMARDARGLLDGGYTLAGLRAFDLFPNTPHVEALAVFDKGER